MKDNRTLQELTVGDAFARAEPDHPIPAGRTAVSRAAA